MKKGAHVCECYVQQSPPHYDAQKDVSTTTENENGRTEHCVVLSIGWSVPPTPVSPNNLRVHMFGREDTHQFHSGALAAAGCTGQLAWCFLVTEIELLKKIAGSPFTSLLPSLVVYKKEYFPS